MSEIRNHMEDSLLMLFITGEADKEQKETVQNWLRLSDDNQAYFDRLHEVWTKVSEIDSSPIVVDIDSAWDKVSAKIDFDSEESEKHHIKAHPKNRGFNYTILRIAALFIIGIGLYYIFSIFSSKDNLVLLASQDQIIIDTLSDGSIIALNSNSVLSYPEAFDETVRNVELKGEAYFDVERNPEKSFVISAGDSYIKVLGTSFNVKAYEDSSFVEVSVVSGIVQLYTLDENKDTLSVLLSKNEIGIYSVNARTVKKIGQTQANDFYWASKTLVFEKTKLSKVFEMLEITFNVSIDVVKPEINELLFSATFIDNTGDEILEIISATFNLKIDKVDTKYTISQNESIDE